MATRPFRKQGGGDEESFRKQANVENALGNLRNSIILDGVFLENVQVYTLQYIIPHKLGRKPRGYIICKNNQLNNVAYSSGTFDETLFIALIATTDCVLNLWIF